REIATAAQPAHVRMASNDARRGARGVDENAVEGPAVPPAGRVGRVADDQRGGLRTGRTRLAESGRPRLAAAGHIGRSRKPAGRCKAEPFEVLAHLTQSQRVDVERRERDVGELEQVRGLPARRRTGVEYALTILRI